MPLEMEKTVYVCEECAGLYHTEEQAKECELGHAVRGDA